MVCLALSITFCLQLSALCHPSSIFRLQHGLHLANVCGSFGVFGFGLQMLNHQGDVWVELGKFEQKGPIVHVTQARPHFIDVQTRFRFLRSRTNWV